MGMGQGSIQVQVSMGGHEHVRSFQKVPVNKGLESIGLILSA